MKKNTLKKIIKQQISLQYIKTKTKKNIKNIISTLDKINNLISGQGYITSKQIKKKLEEMNIQCQMINKWIQQEKKKNPAGWEFQE